MPKNQLLVREGTLGGLGGKMGVLYWETQKSFNGTERRRVIGRGDCTELHEKKEKNTSTIGILKAPTCPTISRKAD